MFEDLLDQSCLELALVLFIETHRTQVANAPRGAVLGEYWAGSQGAPGPVFVK